MRCQARARLPGRVTGQTAIGGARTNFNSDVTLPHLVLTGTLGGSGNTFPASVQIRGSLIIASSAVTVQVQGTLTLEPGSLLQNPGIVRVAAFVNNGGTIIGNPPVLAAEPLRIQSISLIGAENSPAPGSGVVASPPRMIVLLWKAEPGRQFTVEASTDNKSWSVLPVQMAQPSPGTYSAQFTPGPEPVRFFRLRVAGQP